MTDERFWRIVDKYEINTDHITGIESEVQDTESAMKEIVYYDRGDLGKSVSDYSLLIKSNYGGKDEYLKVVDTIKALCAEYNSRGMKEYKKIYKKVFTN